MRRSATLLAIPLLLACGGGEDLSYATGDRATAREVEAVARPAPQQIRTSGPDSLVPRMVIRRGEARVEVEAIDPAVDALRALAEGLGGYTTDVTVRTGATRRREATVQLRIPSARFDSALAALPPLGEVQDVTVSAQDVGEEYVDVQARLANDRRLEARLLELLEERTGDLEDVLAVERELARVRSAIDRQEGRLRYLRDQVATSTLSVHLQEPVPLVSSYRGDNVIAGAFRAAWRNFVLLVAGFIASLGYLIPVGAGLAVAWLWIRRARRRGDATSGPRRPVE